VSTTRFNVVTEMARRLGTIRIVNGFRTDAGLLLFVGETPTLGPSDPDSALALVIRDTKARHTGENVLEELLVEVQAIVKSKVVGPSLALEQIIEDVKRAVETSDRTLGGLLMNQGITRGATKVLEREAGSEFVAVGVEYVLMMTEKWGAP
jgi:hypothetical protein